MLASWYIWERHPFQRMPPPEAAIIRAREVRERLMPSAWDEPLATLDAVCEAAGVAVLGRDLGAASGGVQGVLVPLAGDRFRALVDPVPYGGFTGHGADDRVVRRHRARFRIAHELAHTFFFWREGDRPRRCLRDSVAQERFCDLFAAELLLPCAVAAATEPEPSGVARLAARYGVSIQLAVRAVADAHGSLPFALWRASKSGPILQASQGNPNGAVAHPIAGGRQLLVLGV